MSKQPLSRRKLLIGSGSAIALPLLASMGGRLPGLRSGLRVAPRRLIFLNFGYGTSKAWYPTTTGFKYQLSEAMAPLERHRQHFSVLGNLSNMASAAGNPHWGCSTFLTSANTRRTPGREFHNDISCDQVAAAQLGRDVRIPSLELSGNPATIEGCGPGASMSWDAQGNSIQGESNHVAFFQRLFGGHGVSLEERRQLLESERSVLDVIRLDAQSISKRVGVEDRDKLDEYFSLIRNIERRLLRDELWLGRPMPETSAEQPPRGLQGTMDIEMMFDLMLLALQTDSTRVITYRLPTNTLLSEFTEQTGLSSPAHQMTHYGSQDTSAYQALVWRDQKLCQLFATLIDKLKATRDVDGQSLLANTLVVMGSGIRTAHIRQNLPILLAGEGGGKLKHGAHHLYTHSEGKLSNLWLSMLRQSGCQLESFADSDGPLTEVFG